MNIKDGDITEISVMCECIKHGVSVSLPYGGQYRYDQIWDIDGKLSRVQIKTAQAFEHGFTIPGKSSKKYTDGEIDGFATIFEGVVYYVPFDDMTANTKKFYLRPPRDRNQLGDLSWACDYELKNYL